MRQPGPRRTASHAGRASDIGIAQLRDLVQIDRLTNKRLQSYGR
jgi:hypothetical protein